MESFFKTLKVERTHRLRYDTRAIAKLDIVNWIEGFYNHRRMHSSIGYKTPAAVESNLMVSQSGVRRFEAGSLFLVEYGSIACTGGAANRHSYMCW